MKIFQSDKPVWKAGRAWWCVLAIILAELVKSKFLRIFDQYNHAWLMTNQYTIQNTLKIFQAGLWLLIVYLFSGAQSTPDFVQRVGLNQRPTLWGWWGAWIAVGIAFIDHYGVVKGLTSTNSTVRDLFHHRGYALSFFVLSVVSIGPFFEEVV